MKISIHKNSLPTVFFVCLQVCTGLWSSQPSLVGEEESPSLPGYREIFGKPALEMDAFEFSFPDSATSILKVYCEFTHDILQFVSNESGAIEARYELSLEAWTEDDNKHKIMGKTWQDTLRSDSFPGSESRSKTVLHTADFPLEPGPYSVVLKLTDLATSRTITHKKSCKIRGRDPAAIAVSDVMIIEGFEEERNNAIPTPNLRRVFIDPELPFWAFFQIVSYSPDSIHLHVTVMDENRATFHEESSTLTGGTIRQVVPLQDWIGTAGRFVIRVEVTGQNERIVRQQGFVMQYAQALPDTVAEDARWKAIKLVAPRKVFEQMQAVSDERREPLVAEFWQSRDPSPATVENELRREFEQRVLFALRYFSLDRDDTPGWDSDRGRIYIKYGAPPVIKRRDMVIERSPYEFWIYPSILKQFVFLDRNGTGHFKLIHED